MKVTFNKKLNRKAAVMLIVLMIACAPSGQKKNQPMNKEYKNFEKGTYGYDVSFFAKHRINTIELKDENSKACLLLVPGFQGRVMTSSAGGDEGISFGWINYKLIDAGQVSHQFNPYGGEERFWLGPEGGLFSIYFAAGKEQVYENWIVPAFLDTEMFDVKEKNSQSVTFIKNATLKNASGSEFKLGIERKISLISNETLTSFLKTYFPSSCDVVAYQTDNQVTNLGNKPWTKESGLLSIWLLSMFNPSPTTTVFIPYREDGEGPLVNDDYFGKVPSDRLIVENGTIYFKIDGKLRSKIGLPPGRTKGLCGSYDSEKNVLTILWCSMPSVPKPYVNSKWGKQDNPYDGDAINSYNDGPVADGTVMGPFYEIETSSPAAALLPNESIIHTQKVIHIHGNDTILTRIVKEIFNLDLQTIAEKFK
jgi:hypothetical protein